MKPKFKISLDFFANMESMHRIEQPQTVYHFTNRKNVESILKDGFIHTGDDVCCWFFKDLRDIPIFLAITHAETSGRVYWDYDGRLHTAMPIDRNDTVVLKLKPRYSEPDKWFMEIVEAHSEQETPGASLEEAKKAFDAFNCRIVHYGKMKFNTFPENIEKIELADVFNMGFSYSAFEQSLLENA